MDFAESMARLRFSVFWKTFMDSPRLIDSRGMVLGTTWLMSLQMITPSCMASTILVYVRGSFPLTCESFLRRDVM